MSNIHFPKSRFTASFIHLLLSAVLLTVLISVVAFLWFPGALLLAGGAEQGLKIVIAVDMVLGPLLTLVIYNINKARKELIRDLAIIAVIQFSCLSVGMSLVYEQRPLAVVYSGSDFHILDKKQLKKYDIELARLEAFPGNFPKVIFEKPPEDEEENAHYTLSKSPFFPLSFHSDLWIAFPTDKITLEKYFKIDEDSNCINIMLNNYGQLGSVCFNHHNLTFSHYSNL